MSLLIGASARTAMAGGLARPFVLLPPAAAGSTPEQRNLILAPS